VAKQNKWGKVTLKLENGKIASQAWKIRSGFGGKKYLQQASPSRTQTRGRQHKGIKSQSKEREKSRNDAVLKLGKKKTDLE